MKPRILFAITLTVPALALACAKPGKQDVQAPGHPATPAAETPAQQPSGATSACCRNATCDDKGRIVRKPKRDGGFLEYIYHPHSGKLILVLDGSHKTEYHYNDAGNVQWLANSYGKLISLEYGGDAKIRRMLQVDRTTGERRDFAFRYNAAGKPVSITLAGVGKMTVEYDDKGDIKKTDYSGGTKMVLQVAQAFQTLSSVARPGSPRY